MEDGSSVGAWCVGCLRIEEAQIGTWDIYRILKPSAQKQFVI